MGNPVRAASDGAAVNYLFTDNETNPKRHPDAPSMGDFFKDAFHEYVVLGARQAVDPRNAGTKVAAYSIHTIPAGGQVVLKARMASVAQTPEAWFGTAFEEVFAARQREANEFYDECIPKELNPGERLIARQAYAGLLWTKQFYHYVVQP